MRFKFLWLRNNAAENFHGKFRLGFQAYLIKGVLPHTPISYRPFFGISDHIHHTQTYETTRNCHETTKLSNPVAVSDDSFNVYDQSAVYVQNVLKFRRHKPVEEIETALNRCSLVLTDDFVLQVLRRHRSDWKPAFDFFNWVTKRGNGEGEYSPGSVIYNEILDILGKSRRFEEVDKVFVEMSKRKKLVNEETYLVLLNRYAAAHKVEEAIDIFHRRQQLGLEMNLIAFQSLLMWLCRYKHVEIAETLFHSKKHEFFPDIKTSNIVLNGWCVLGNVHEAKRFWREIIESKWEPDIYTYGTLINSLTKKGKLGTALNLYRAMWEKGLKPDVVICNCIIDALCFKKRIPEALEIFKEMNERGCASNVATYNTLIKHLCKIRRMEKVNELLDEMVERNRSCWPNSVTFSYLLASVREPEEIPKLVERMERSGCKMSSDTYNLILRLYMEWDIEERVKCTWNEMEEIGLGPDRRSYTIMIHGLYEKGRKEEGLRYYREMTLKGMMVEAKTERLVNAMNVKLQKRRHWRDIRC
ncbi:putative pentatricopeptide repeat-containing protein At3g15200 isoform X1 [Cucurbita maxima]|uniref:Pentatricopeptide repeat-containing protein At3g15200 isoform X1 n=2 Tax=Cucurbita maxima TaxID=3661 RepID=A0A6J1I9V6_CUCMA|nr:putative pentatricopeptide repeat-containing protein At3g15200 isoform X1 [Cucurbita maxima]